jgi:hypothetical protein
MPMAGPGLGSAGGDVLTGRAWLGALPEELAAQRRVMARLADLCKTWPQVMSLLVGCSLGRGAADALSDIDAALGVDAPPGAAGAGRIETAEAMVAAALPEMGTVVDVLRHQVGPESQHVRRIFAQFADGVQLDLAVVAETEIETRRRTGGAPDFVPLHEARHYIWVLWAASNGAMYPWHGLSQVLDHDPGNLPPGIESTVAGLDAPGLRRAARASADVLATVSQAAARRHPADLPAAMAAYVTGALSSEP